jgi:hypothetical protein
MDLTVAAAVTEPDRPAGADRAPASTRRAGLATDRARPDPPRGAVRAMVSA